MIQLCFKVRGQTISRADRFYVVEQSQNYLRAHFEFITKDWDDLQKIAVFTKDGTSYKIILEDDHVATVPWELLTDVGTITVSVYGVGQDTVLETVNTAEIDVKETGYVTDAENETEPTPEVWEQILRKLENTDGGTFEDWKEG